MQAEVENALSTLLRCPVDLVGAGRTDTGVHALGYAAHFDYNGAIDSPAKFCHALNGILPGSIAIHSLTEVDGDFHARFSATSRQYIYLISRETRGFCPPARGDLRLRELLQGWERPRYYHMQGRHSPLDPGGGAMEIQHYSRPIPAEYGTRPGG